MLHRALLKFRTNWDHRDVLLIAMAMLWLVTGVQGQTACQAASLVLAVVMVKYRFYRLNQRLADDQRSYRESVAAIQLRTLEALALAVEAKDHTTHDHLRRVQVYATEIGKDLGLPENEMRALHAAALIHDIGKLAVPEHIISKPGRLTPEEFEKMKIHPTVGAEILAHMDLPFPVVPIVLAHHEKWDGTGYPNGLKGEEIPLGARILATVDCLDALASDRQYRRALPLNQAIEKVAEESGRSYDPQVVEVLVRRYPDLERRVLTAQLPGLASTSIKVLNGAAPATGFESESCVVGPRELPFMAWISSARLEAQLLQEITRELGNTLSLKENLSVLSMRLKPLVPYDALVIYVRREDRLVPEHTAGELGHLFRSREVPVGEGLVGWVSEHNKPILNGNPTVEPGMGSDTRYGRAVRSALAVPLPGATGQVNVLALYHRERDGFTRDQLRVVLAVSSKVGLTIENALKFEDVENSASTDYLTSLPNARSLFEHLRHQVAAAQEAGSTLSVLVSDIDGFKQVNDRFGHLDGNRLLSRIAKGLKQICRDSDYVARLGGDEFVLVLPACTRDVLDSRFGKLREIAEDACRDVCGEAFISMSMGVATYPHDGIDAEELLAEADRRMYADKREHKGFTPETAANATQDLLVLAGCASATREPVLNEPGAIAEGGRAEAA